MDAELHRKRIDVQGQKVTYRASLDALPDGCFVRIEDASYLLWNDNLLLWSCDGYVGKQSRASGSEVIVLTPESIVECIRQGFTPAIHTSSLEVLEG
jgi:hypothetical protein